MGLSGSPQDHTCGGDTSSGTHRRWRVPVLWEAAQGLAVTSVEVGTILETYTWGCWLYHLPDLDHPLVVPEMPRVIAADLTYPILFHPDGWLMDGYHRVAKALLQGRTHLPCVRFTGDTLPDPTWVTFPT